MFRTLYVAQSLIDKFSELEIDFTTSPAGYEKNFRINPLGPLYHWLHCGTVHRPQSGDVSF